MGLSTIQKKENLFQSVQSFFYSKGVVLGKNELVLLEIIVFKLIDYKSKLLKHYPHSFN